LRIRVMDIVLLKIQLTGLTSVSNACRL
jgi:hypothetical protein